MARLLSISMVMAVAEEARASETARFSPPLLRPFRPACVFEGEGTGWADANSILLFPRSITMLNSQTIRMNNASENPKCECKCEGGTCTCTCTCDCG
ncbi:hypothetical protein ACERK3_01670 [Phycisphaerales bacterium AB-hyl4]|uniref:Metallothionein n=1 Tax=Natronomicrosphaera hydrolytica TaxID=3242702 RepID=A0ABV4U0U2_9BACT